MHTKYKIILSDCPWKFNREFGKKAANGAATYSTMDLNDLKTLSVKQISDKNSILFLWACMPKLQEALDVIRAWGFTYKTCAFTWIKTNKDGNPRMGLGHYTRSSTEICLLATRGRISRINNKIMQVLQHPIGKHSEKPIVIHDKIKQLMGDLPSIELFARKTVPGWLCIGNEITGRDIKEDLQLIIDGKLS